jgi:AcrR family transcriptional regulator
VATRAGVHKTTLYRRWPSPEALLLEAALEYSADSVPVPDTGSLRDDLFLLARHVAESLRSSGPQAMLRAVIVQAEGSPELVESARSYWRTRFEHLSAIVQRGIERGEVSFSVDPHLVVELLIGPMYLRALITQELVDDDFIKGVVDLIAAAATGDSLAHLDGESLRVSTAATGSRTGGESG